MRFTGRAMLTHTGLGLWVAAQTRAGGAGTTPASAVTPGRPRHVPRTLPTHSAHAEPRLQRKRKRGS